MNDNLTLNLEDFGDSTISKAFDNELQDYLEKAKAAQVGTINKYNEMKMPDGSWKYVGKQGIDHPSVAHVKELLENSPSGGDKKGVDIEKYDSSKHTGKFKPGEVATKDGIEYIKTKNDGGWVPYKDYLESWGGNPPKEHKPTTTTTPTPEDKPKPTESKESDKKESDSTTTPDSQDNKKSESDKLPILFNSVSEVVSYLDKNIHSLTHSELTKLMDTKTGFDGTRVWLKYQSNSLFAFPELRSDLTSFDESLTDSLSKWDYDSSDPNSDQHIKADFSKLTRSQILCIKAYTNDAFKLINRVGAGKYTDKHGLTPEIAKFVQTYTDLLNDGISKIKNKKKINTVWRGFSSRKGSVSDQRKIYTEKMIGYTMALGGTSSLSQPTIEYNTILSTSEKSEKAFSALDGINYRINKNVSGKCVEDISRFSSESELIFPTTTKFIVKEVNMFAESMKIGGFEHRGRNFVILEEYSK